MVGIPSAVISLIVEAPARDTIKSVTFITDGNSLIKGTTLTFDGNLFGLIES